MEALVTATFSDEELEKLGKKADITRDGWGFTGNRLNSQEIANRLDNKEILIVELDEVGEEVFENNPNLKVLGCCRGNPVNVDINAANKYGIPVINTPARNAIAVAELTIAFMINIARNVGNSFMNLKKGNWNINNKIPFTYYKGIEIKDKTIGLIGFGAIAKEITKRLKPFGVEVLTYDPYVSHKEIEKYNINEVSLEELLQNSDFVSLHTKVTEETKGMIGTKEFNLMKNNAYLINTARAKIINRKSLLNALKNNKIAGAALDVYYKEPISKDNPLLNMDNVFVTPHIGGATEEVKKHHSKIVLNGIFKILKGEKPSNLFNQEVWEYSNE